MKKWIFLLVVILAVSLYIGNTRVSINEVTIESEKIPANFNDWTILQISDLHDATFGEKQVKLVNKIKDINPDIIFITGDIIDSNRYDLQNSLNLVNQIINIAPVYYVTGNHEIATNDVNHIKTSLQDVGVHVLTNEEEMMEYNGEKMRIIGIEDPLSGFSVNEQLKRFEGSEDYTLVLSHRPEVFQDYVDYKMDLVFSGHAHGGQFRIPGLGGLVAPGQGVFPKYTSGTYEAEDTTMIVSRGLGNSLVPIRVFNTPELVVVTLKSK
ncbi:metallophosphoesterase [Psychrobacillus sp. FSL K6-2684]|uniref:metallophosphoesterase n=1 Tax=Psychrobacillus sp. FSL K6-2684 TaxID=2921547 RepID=UPI0030FAA5CD